MTRLNELFENTLTTALQLNFKAGDPDQRQLPSGHLRRGRHLNISEYDARHIYMLFSNS
jgi:hypothetical protein